MLCMLCYAMLKSSHTTKRRHLHRTPSGCNMQKTLSLAHHHASPPKHPKTPRYNANAGLSRSLLTQKSYSPTIVVPSPIRIFSTVFPLTPFNNARLAKS